MSNPYVNKVQKSDGTILMDVTSDTLKANILGKGYTGHDKSGAPITGTMPLTYWIDTMLFMLDPESVWNGNTLLTNGEWSGNTFVVD